MFCRINSLHILLSIVLFILLSVTRPLFAIEQEITERHVISGAAGRISISPYHISPRHSLSSVAWTGGAQSSAIENSAVQSREHILYEIDYSELKHQIKTYQQIYVTGQLLHGYLMIKMKPKFVD